jgi:mono/diheme cytochrome c family protein
MSPANDWRLGNRGLGRAILGIVGVIALGILAIGCIPTTYSYPIDHFNEMHYQQFYRRQEPPNVVVPVGAIPITGGEPIIATAAYAGQQNPVQRTPENLQAAATLYQRNCQTCHGPQGRGDGIVGAIIRGYPDSIPPKDYNDPTVVALSDGEIFGVLTNGKRDEQTLKGMPSFRTMLTPEERWLLVNQVRVFQGR